MDITQRALAVLRQVDLIAAEDTRQTRVLLQHYGIATPLRAYHEHNEAVLMPRLIQQLEGREAIALVADAGTPLISDPGFLLVREARRRALKVVPVPGPSAAVCALSAAGLASDRFVFLGFPPRQSAQRRSWLQALAAERATLVLYEASHRVQATLCDMAELLGPQRRAVIGRELTKRFETFIEGTLPELEEVLAQDPQQRKGEFVLMVEGSQEAAEETTARQAERVLSLLAEELPLKQAASLAARITGAKKNRLYRQALGWREKDQS
jgi:16S rRNA (cytidine1402-2'-O)-methyltransferase